MNLVQHRACCICKISNLVSDFFFPVCRQLFVYVREQEINALISSKEQRVHCKFVRWFEHIFEIVMMEIRIQKLYPKCCKISCFVSTHNSIVFVRLVWKRAPIEQWKRKGLCENKGICLAPEQILCFQFTIQHLGGATCWTSNSL